MEKIFIYDGSTDGMDGTENTLGWGEGDSAVRQLVSEAAEAGVRAYFRGRGKAR